MYHPTPSVLIFLRKPFLLCRRLDSAIAPFRLATQILNADYFASFFFPICAFSLFKLFLSATTAASLALLLRGIFDTRVISILFRTHARAHSHHIILYVGFSHNVSTYRQTRAHRSNNIIIYCVLISYYPCFIGLFQLCTI